MDSNNSTSTRRFAASPTAPQPESVARYVIQRTGETFREWWTGDQWSSNENLAKEYCHDPDVSVETHDESAKAVRVDGIDD